MQVNEVVVNGVTELSLVNDTVSEDTLIEGATAHDASGKQITGKFVPYNPNLLDNPDFAINQRGQTEYDLTDIAYGYTVDRWSVGWAKGFTKKLTVSDDGVTLSSSGGEAYLYQRLENPKDFYNKPFTFSLSIESISGSALISAVGNSNVNGTVSLAPLTVTEPGVVSITFAPDEIFAALRVQLRISNGGTVKTNRAKLEPGEIQTLARQDDEGNWIIIDPPTNPALELEKCQRHLFTPPCISSSNYLNKTNSMWFLIPLPTTMRTTPSILQDTVINLYSCEGNALLESDILKNSEYSITSHGFAGGKQLIILINKASHGHTSGQVYLSLPAGSGGFSAEL